MADVGDLILQPIQLVMAQRCYLIAWGYIPVEIVHAQLGDKAGVVHRTGENWTFQLR